MAPLASASARPLLPRVGFLGAVVYHQMDRDRVFTHAAALTYKTLFSLVPVIVLSLLLVSTISGGKGRDSLVNTVKRALLEQLDADKLQITDQDGRQVNLETYADGLIRSAEKELGKNATGAGLVTFGVLLYGAVSLMAVIEGTFNLIYGAAARRSWVRRITLYWSVLTLGPIGVAVSLSLGRSAYTMAADHVGAAWLVSAANLAISFGVSWVLIFFMYRLIPEARVAWRAAALGALVAAVAWEIGKWGFGLYVATAVPHSWYGSLAILPLFMMWIYITWTVVLVGLEMAYLRQYWPLMKRHYLFVHAGRGARRAGFQAGLADVRLDSGAGGPRTACSATFQGPPDACRPANRSPDFARPWRRAPCETGPTCTCTPPAATARTLPSRWSAWQPRGPGCHRHHRPRHAGRAAPGPPGRGRHRFEIIRAVEITTEHHGRELHLLAYFVAEDDRPLNDALAWVRRQRIERFHAMLERLRQLGVDLPWQPTEQTPDALGRRYLAELLVQAGRVGSVREAFARYLKDGGPCVVSATGAGRPASRLAVAEAIRLVRQAGGVACWAHPGPAADWPALVELAGLGLGAVEVEYPEVRQVPAAGTAPLGRTARSWPITGGSDCHGPGRREVGCCSVSARELERLRHTAGGSEKQFASCQLSVVSCQLRNPAPHSQVVVRERGARRLN